MKIEIKKEYLNAVVGFNGSAKPLGQRNDIALLAEIALQSGNKNLLKYFKKIPTLQDVREIKGEQFLKKNSLIRKTAAVKAKKEAEAKTEKPADRQKKKPFEAEKSAKKADKEKLYKNAKTVNKNAKES